MNLTRVKIRGIYNYKIVFFFIITFFVIISYLIFAEPIINEVCIDDVYPSLKITRSNLYTLPLYVQHYMDYKLISHEMIMKWENSIQTWRTELLNNMRMFQSVDWDSPECKQFWDLQRKYVKFFNQAANEYNKLIDIVYHLNGVTLSHTPADNLPQANFETSHYHWRTISALEHKGIASMIDTKVFYNTVPAPTGSAGSSIESHLLNTSPTNSESGK